MAETVGRAYVKILADGSGMSKSIKDALGDADKDVEAASDRHSKAYAEEWAKRDSQEKIGKNIQDALERGAAKSDVAQAYFKSRNWKKFTTQLKKRFGDAGIVAADEFMTEFGHDIEGLDTSVESVIKRIQAIRQRLSKQQLADHAEAIRINEALDKKAAAAEAQRLRQHAEAIRLNAAFDKRVAAEEQARLRQHAEALRINAALDKKAADEEQARLRLHATAVRINAQIDQKAHDDEMRRLREHAEAIRLNEAFDERITRRRITINRLHAQALADIEKEEKRIADERRKHAAAWIKDLDSIANGIGRAFGKGSRNNFLNFFGSFIGNIARLPAILGQSAFKIVDFVKSIGTAWTDAGGGVSGFIAAVSKITPALGAATVGFIGFIALLGTVTSALLLTAGAAAALASTIGFALVGAVAPLAGLLGPLAVGAGAVAIAFIGMDEAGKQALKNTLQPMKEFFQGIGNAIRPGILEGVANAWERLTRFQGTENSQKLLFRITKMFESAGDAIGDFINQFAIGIRGPGLGQFIKVMTTELPRILGNLGRIFGNTFEGISGILATLNRRGGPVQDLLTSLNGLMKDFAEWSVSPGAATFFDNAQESASALLDFLKPVWDLTSEILNAGRSTGDSLFRSMGETISGWVDKLRANPDILRNFFDDAKRMGEALGNVIVQVGHLIDALDTPLTRDWAIGFINMIADLIGKIASLINWFAGLDRGIQEFILTMGAAFAVIRNFTGGLGLGLLIDGLRRSEGALSTFEETLGGALAGFAVGGPLGLALGATAGLFHSLFLKSSDAEKAIKDAADGAADSVGDWEDLGSTLNDVTGAMTEQTKAFIYDKLQKDKTITAFEKMGVSGRTVVDALMGNKQAALEVAAAQKIVEDRIARNTAQIDEYDRRLTDMRANRMGGTQAFKDLEDQRNKLAESTELQKNWVEGVKAGTSAINTELTAAQKRAAALADWNRILGQVPKKVITAIETAGTPVPQKIRQVEALVKQYHLAPRKVRTIVEALGIEVSDKKLKRIIARMKEADKEVKPKVKPPDTGPVDKKIQQTTNKFAELGRTVEKVPTARPKVDSKDAENKVNNLKKNLDEAGRKKPQPKIVVDNSQALSAIGAVRNELANLPTSKTITIHVNTVKSGGPATASGGVFLGAQTRLIGEAGPEAVVPLSRSLAQVDPAVRALSAIAQGLRTGNQSGGLVSNRALGVVTINVSTPTKDPVAVANETVNRLVGLGYAN